MPDSKIRQAIIDMAYDNGCINRDVSEGSLLNRVMNELNTLFSENDLLQVEEFLSSLTEAQFVEITTGEFTLTHSTAFFPALLETVTGRADITDIVLTTAFNAL